MLLGCPAVHAQAPLSVEQLIVDAARWQLVAATDFRSAGEGVAAFRDLTATATLRYGLRQDLELNAGLRQTRSYVPAAAGDESPSASSLSVGATWQARDEGRWPALVLEGRFDVLAMNPGGDRGPGGAAVAATAYRSTDPLVLSLTAAYTARRPFERGDLTVAPGSGWRLEPMVNFAVNPAVTLFGGMALARQEGTRIEGRRVFPAQYNVSLKGGVAWAPGPRSTIFVSGELASAQGGGGMSLRWLRDF